MDDAMDDVPEIFDSQDKSIQGMRCSVRSWERYTSKNEVKGEFK
jgi:hypothetical protein